MLKLPKILLIDDDPHFCQTIKELFAATRSEFLICHEPQQAVTMVLQHEPALILLDLYFKDSLGLDVLKERQVYPQLLQIPVMVITASSDSAILAEAMRLGAADILRKPFSVAYFEKKINSFLGADFFNQSGYSPDEKQRLQQNPVQTVLLVDDDPGIQHLVSDLLRDFGYQVLSASNGQLGLQLAQSGGPDLILLNLNMPVMGGVEMLMRMRQDAQLSQLPVIVLTGSSELTKIEEVKALGISGCLIKPFGLQALIHLIKQTLGTAA